MNKVTVVLSNTVRIFLFTMLALAFSKWWVVLFSIFFVTDLNSVITVEFNESEEVENE